VLTAFREDAARWVVPGEVVPAGELRFGTIIRLLYHHLPLRAMLIWRFAAWCRQKKIPGVFGILHRCLTVFFGVELCSAEKIGGGFYLPHPVGTVIHVENMGRNASVIASVTVGMRTVWAFPVIGDNVFIGAGARILGGITIGNDAVIGANAVVINDVPAGGTVVGIPARLIKRDGRPVAEAGQGPLL
jgi:serine O-acetyltransferase